MPDQDRTTVGGVGEVAVGPLLVTVTPLSQGDELRLSRQLRAEAERLAGDGWTRCRAMLEAMTEAGAHADRMHAVAELVRSAKRKEPLSDEAVFDYRSSAAGVALELFARGKAATPGLTLDGLRAAVTEANAPDVFAAMMEVIQGGEPDAKGNA
jgi:hypothetical protein